MKQSAITLGTLAGLMLLLVTRPAPLAAAEPACPACCTGTDPARISAQPGGSISDVTAAWETDSGKKIKLSDLNGKVRVISMFYATCQGVCLITKQDMQQLDAALSPAARKRVGFILVTLDPLRDTVPSLREYRRDQNLSLARWTLLRGDNDATSQLAALLGVTAGRDASGRFIHSSELVVLDQSGRIVRHYSGLRANLPAIAREIETAALDHPAHS